MKKLVSIFCLFTFVFAVSAETYEWVGGNGNWTTTTMWNPEGTLGADDDASINADGDYKVDINIGGSIAKDITVGTTSSSGTQTLNVNSYSRPVFENLTIGPRGVFIHNNRNIGSPADASFDITIQTNGLYKFTGNRNLGGHNLVIDKGGVLDILSGDLDIGTIGTSFTINGEVTGDGNFKPASNGHNWYGDGKITGNGLLILTAPLANARLHIFHGNLTIDRDIYQEAPTLLNDDVILTINGDYFQTNGTRSLGALNTGGVATFNGDGDFNIVSTNTLGSSELRFGGASQHNNQAGSIVFEGDGSINFVTLNSNYISMTATNLTLAINCFISGGEQDGYFLFNGGNECVIDMNAGKSFTINEGGIVEVENRSYMDKRLIIDDGSSLIMNGGVYRGRIGRTTVGMEDIRIGKDSAGTLLVKNDAVSSFLTKGADNDKKNLRVRLYDQAITDAEKNSTLKLVNIEMIIDMTNRADWGWNENITLDFSDRSAVDPNVENTGKFEALSTDLGSSPSLSDIPLLVNAMSFSTTNMTFELMETSDNDVDGIPDTVVYTKILDFSNLSEGSITLSGLSGDEKVYYGELINPNGITFDSDKWVKANLPLGNGTVIVVQ